MKYIESKQPKNLKVLTPSGFVKVLWINKTIPLPKVRIKTDSFALECAENHSVILDDGSECFAKNSLGKFVRTVSGVQQIISVDYLGYSEEMYDLELEDVHVYYSSGILSHNSGKSITTSIYLTWMFNFNHDLNIGICCNKRMLAQEFLNNVQTMFLSIPMWMQQGITVWNKTSIATESKMRVLIDAPSSDSFRGFSISILVVDECAFINPGTYKDFANSVFPAQSALAFKKNIIISTANGLNHFYDLVQGAKKKKVYANLEADTEIELEDGVIIPLSEFFERFENKSEV